MSDLKDYQQQSSSVFEEDITPETMSRFNSATHATQDGWHSTYVTRYRLGEFEILKNIGVELKELLHGEQEYQYVAEVKLPQKIAYQTVLADVFEKSGRSSKMVFLIFETDVKSGSMDGELLVKTKSTLIVRRPVK